jgi:hypothetical protein
MKTALVPILVVQALCACASSEEDRFAEWRSSLAGHDAARGVAADTPAPRPSSGAVEYRVAPVQDADAALRARLRRERVPGFVLEDVESLRAAANALRTLTGLPIVVHARAEEAAVEAGAVFQLSLQNPIAADDLLDLLVEQAGGDVRWIVRHEAVVLTTVEDARGELALAMHDIRMLTTPRTDFVAPRLDRLRLIDELEDEDGHSVFGDIGESVTMMEEDDVVMLVQETIEPTTWDDDGVQIFAENGALFVRHTPAVQARVRAFLASLGA